MTSRPQDQPRPRPQEAAPQDASPQDARTWPPECPADRVEGSPRTEWHSLLGVEKAVIVSALCAMAALMCWLLPVVITHRTGPLR